MTTKATDQDPAAEATDTTDATVTGGAADQTGNADAGGDGAAAKNDPGKDLAGKDEPEGEEGDPAAKAEPEGDGPEKTKVEKAEAIEEEPATDKAEDTAGKGVRTRRTKTAASTDDEGTGTSAGTADGGRTGRGKSPATRGRGPLGTPLVYGLVAVTLIAAIVTAVLQWREADRLEQADATRQAIRTRAGEFGQALLSYDHRNVDAARKRVMSMAADDFARTYDVAFSGSGGLEGVIAKLQADATATVRTVYVSEIDGSNAKAIVVMDSQVKSRAGTRRVLGSYLEMGLTKQKGKWLVRAVSSIGAANESMTGDPAQGQDSSGGGTGSVLPTGTPSPGN